MGHRNRQVLGATHSQCISKKKRHDNWTRCNRHVHRRNRSSSHNKENSTEYHHEPLRPSGLYLSTDYKAKMATTAVGKTRTECGRKTAGEERKKPRLGLTTDTRRKGTMDGNTETDGKTRKHRVQQIMQTNRRGLIKTSYPHQLYGRK